MPNSRRVEPVLGEQGLALVVHAETEAMEELERAIRRSRQAREVLIIESPKPPTDKSPLESLRQSLKPLPSSLK